MSRRTASVLTSWKRSDTVIFALATGWVLESFAGATVMSLSSENDSRRSGLQLGRISRDTARYRCR